MGGLQEMTTLSIPARNKRLDRSSILQQCFDGLQRKKQQHSDSIFTISARLLYVFADFISRHPEATIVAPWALNQS